MSKVVKNLPRKILPSIIKALQEPHRKKEEKREQENKMRQKVQISEERESKEPEFAIVGSKKTHVFGPLDKMVGDEKLKQTVINEGERKKWRDLAHHL